MLKRFLKWWRTWEVALDGIDDLEGERMASLEERLARLEKEVALMQTVEQRKQKISAHRQTLSFVGKGDQQRGSCSCGCGILVSG